MKLFLPKYSKFFTILFFAILAINCRKESNNQIIVIEKSPISKLDSTKDSLRGKIFRDISEIPQLSDYVHQAGSVIDKVGGPVIGYKYGISQFTNGKNTLIVFEEIIGIPDNPKPKYKILDTLLINALNDDEHIAICTCRINKNHDSEIIAIVKYDEDKEYYDNVIKAWRADIKTEIVTPISNLKKIDCINEGFGSVECGEEDIDLSQNHVEQDSLE